MAGSIIMPKTGMAMEEGVIIQWLIKEGDVVEKDDIIAEIETDKTTMELECDFSGTILKILHFDGETVPVTKVIAWVGEPGEAIPEEEVDRAPVTVQSGNAAESPAGPEAAAEEAAALPTSGDGDKIKATPAARRLAADRGVELSSIAPSGRSGEIRAGDVKAYQGAGIVKATPLAKKIAGMQGIDLKDVQGTGSRGKIYSRDIPSVAMTGGLQAGEDTRVPLTKIQKITGKRMLQSHTEIPPVTIHTKADVSDMLEIRVSLKQKSGLSLTINDFVLRAAILALKDNPRVNSVLDGEDLVYKGEINLGVAVATDRGLLVPVLKHAAHYSMTDLSSEARQLAERARDGKLAQDDLEGGTFTVSNIGKFGITAFTPIINQPEAAILGVCAVTDELKMVDGQVVSRSYMGLSLTFDHRIVDGAESAQFLKTIKDYLEDPLAMLVK
jgi:pyruvate dehydrogenase E2 component (dihydrolipoamide acetyltransferase)